MLDSEPRAPGVIDRRHDDEASPPVLHGERAKGLRLLRRVRVNAVGNDDRAGRYAELQEHVESERSHLALNFPGMPPVFPYSTKPGFERYRQALIESCRADGFKRPRQ